MRGARLRVPLQFTGTVKGNSEVTVTAEGGTATSTASGLGSYASFFPAVFGAPIAASHSASV